MLTVQPAGTPRDRKRFVRIARQVYPTESVWVRPLDQVLLDALDPSVNPFFLEGNAQAFLACRDGRDVGRILAHVWQRHHRLHGERVGYFGYFECDNDPEAARALLNAAIQYAEDAGCECLRGPFNMTAAQEMGLLLSGFVVPPALGMAYTPPEYPAYLEAAGFRPCFRMGTWYNSDIAGLNPEEMRRGLRRDLVEIHARHLDGRRRRDDLENVREVVNAAFLGNWGFVPITPDEWAQQVGPVVPWLDPELIQLAEVRGVPVGVTFAAPDFNRLLRRMNGQLIHPAALALFGRPPTDGAVVILIAVRKQFQGLGISTRLNAELVRALHRRRYRSLAATWVADDNAPSQAQVRRWGMRRMHTLAMYERMLRP